MQSFGGPIHSKITSDGTGLIEDCNRKKCFYCLFIEMEFILLGFPTYVVGSSLAEIKKIENTRISNLATYVATVLSITFSVQVIPVRAKPESKITNVSQFSAEFCLTSSLNLLMSISCFGHLDYKTS